MFSIWLGLCNHHFQKFMKVAIASTRKEYIMLKSLLLVGAIVFTGAVMAEETNNTKTPPDKTHLDSSPDTPTNTTPNTGVSRPNVNNNQRPSNNTHLDSTPDTPTNTTPNIGNAQNPSPKVNEKTHLDSAPAPIDSTSK